MVPIRSFMSDDIFFLASWLSNYRVCNFRFSYRGWNVWISEAGSCDSQKAPSRYIGARIGAEREERSGIAWSAMRSVLSPSRQPFGFAGLQAKTAARLLSSRQTKCRPKRKRGPVSRSPFVHIGEYDALLIERNALLF